MSSRPRPFLSALAITLRSTLAGAVAIALIDVLLTVLRANQPVPLTAAIRALQAALGFYGVAGLLLGFGAGLVAGGVAATLPLGDSLARWRVTRSDEARDRAQAAGVLAAAGALGLLGALVFVYAIVLGLEMNNKHNGALTIAMAAMAGVPFVALAWFPIYRVTRVLVAPLPRPRVLWVLGALASLVVLGMVGAVASVDWRVLDFGPVESLAIFAIASALHARFWYGDAGTRLRERFSPRARTLLVAGTALGLLACLSLTWLRFGDEPRSLALVGEESMGAKVLLRVARRFADKDHDGYAGRLGGGDCDDHNPKIHPGADDIRGNHVDEDCDGADAPIAVERPATVEKASAAASTYAWKGNILVITIDTLRADRVNEKQMPRLSAFRKQAVAFTHAYAQAPNTPRSFPSFLTSRFPSEVKWVRMNMNFPTIRDVPENTTFFQALHAAAYRTVGVFSHFYLKPENGIAGGFDVWDNEGALSIHDSNTDIAAPRITPRVIAQLKTLAKSGQKFTLWTHFFEPHSRYVDHEEFPSTSSGLKGLEEKYDGEVSFVDRYLGQVLDALDAAGLTKDTAVVIFSDHGEAFGEHKFGGERMYFHGQTLYDELLRVPLLMRVPGLSPRTVDEPVMLMDLGPTLVDLVKAKRPPSFHGRSLLGALLGEKLAPQPIYAELLPTPSWNHLWRAIIEGNLKLIHKLSENMTELYDLAQDPTEQKNLSGSDDRAGKLQKSLRAFLSSSESG